MERSFPGGACEVLLGSQALPHGPSCGWNASCCSWNAGLSMSPTLSLFSLCQPLLTGLLHSPLTLVACLALTLSPSLTPVTLYCFFISAHLAYIAAATRP